MRRIFVMGIGTGVGKTIAAAVLTEKLQADYWKPVQAGTLEDSDSLTVKGLLSNKKSIIHPEKYRLKTPASPHYAASCEGLKIDINDLTLPDSRNTLIIEGAGGLHVPLNEKGDLFIDLAQKWKTEVVLVSQNYLGSINHTLLSVEAVENRGLKVAGIIFNGDENSATEKFLLNYTRWPLIGKIRTEAHFDKELIKKYASTFII